MARNFCEDERVISAFMTCYRMVDIMKVAGISKTTAYKVRNDPNFQKVLRERKGAILKAAVNKMQSYVEKDIDVLQTIIDDPETSPGTKVSAIQTMLNQYNNWVTTVDIVERIEALEKPSEGVSIPFEG